MEGNSIVEEINLYDLMRYYAKNWLNLLGAIFVGAIIGVAFTALVQTPLYKSDATLIITGRTSSTDTTINNYAELFKSRSVLGEVVKESNYDGNYDKLFSLTTAETDKNTDVLRISMADQDAQKSQELLTASVDTFKDKAGKIYSNPNNIKVVDSASLPTKPYNVKTTMQIGLAMATTFFIAIIVLFFVYDYKNSNPKHTTATKKSNKKSTQKTTKNSGGGVKNTSTSPRTKKVFKTNEKTSRKK